MVKDYLAHTNRLWRNLHILVGFDILETFLQTHHGLRHNTSFLITSTGTNVGELLGFRHINHEVIIVNMFANHLTEIHLFTWVDEEFTTVLLLINRISKGSTRFQCNHRTIHSTCDIAFVWLVFLEPMRHDSLTLTGRKEIGSKSDDTT